MKKMLSTVVAMVILLSMASVVLASGNPPEGLAGTLAITAKTDTLVTLHAEQIGGTQVTLSLYHYCYINLGQPDQVYLGYESVRFQGSVDATFNIGPRRFHGDIVTPTECYAYLWYFSSNASAMPLAHIDTLP